MNSGASVMAARQQLTIRQAKFVDLYIETGNAYQAYRQAGYTSNENRRNCTDVKASQLIRKPKVASAIACRLEEHCKSSMIRFETKRLALWGIAQECKLTDPKAAIAAIHELNRMDGHHIDSKVKALPEHFVFDQEILPPEGYLLDAPEDDKASLL